MLPFLKNGIYASYRTYPASNEESNRKDFSEELVNKPNESVSGCFCCDGQERLSLQWIQDMLEVFKVNEEQKCSCEHEYFGS